jgi:calcineurin-like phosphoesterase family protein
MNTFFTSDTHFGHANIIRYCKRPYCQVEDFDSEGQWKNKYIKRTRAREMDADMISRWNAVVGKNDLVYHLGDFCQGSSQEAFQYLRHLNGHIKFIYGNHDRPIQDVSSVLSFYPDLRNRVDFLGVLRELTIEGQEIVLCHYALRTWNGMHHGSWHVYGHSHGSLVDDPNVPSLDVGVDVHDYRPISFDELAIYMAKKPFVPIDHHGKR